MKTIYVNDVGLLFIDEKLIYLNTAKKDLSCISKKFLKHALDNNGLQDFCNLLKIDHCYNIK